MTGVFEGATERLPRSKKVVNVDLTVVLSVSVLRAVSDSVTGAGVMVAVVGSGVWVCVRISNWPEEV